MCGLFGISSSSLNLEKARECRDLQLNRGPNQAGEWVGDGVYIGHRRLSILDLSENGRQPMVNADSSVVITVNGEIYNFEKLRTELKLKGYTFNSNSDSEVVLHGYKEWGANTLLEKIDGMYAIVIYDIPAQKMIIARDRAGIKPLYYSLENGFIWSSEVKSIENYLGRENLELDNTALYDFLVYRYIPSPKTHFKQIHKLPPAHYLTYDLETKTSKTQRYWELPTASINISIEDASRKVKELLTQSVKEQLVADVPVGFFLSGGIDSSLVVATSAPLKEQLHTYTIGFGVKGFDETEYAKQVAEQFKTKHHEQIITAELETPFSEWMLNLYGEPFADKSALPTWYVSGCAAKNSVVVLTGDGGDELFGGYKWYKDIYNYHKIFSFMKFLPSFIWKIKWPIIHKKTRYKKIVENIQSKSFLQLYNQLFFTTVSVEKLKKLKVKLNIPEDYDEMWFFKKYWKPELGKYKALQYLDFHTFMPEDVLTKVDRATMNHSIESRVPFLSKELMEFSFSLPENILYHNGWLKGLLKHAYADVLPHNILHRPKKGFSIPWNVWGKKMSSQKENIMQIEILESVLKNAEK